MNDHKSNERGPDENAAKKEYADMSASGNAAEDAAENAAPAEPDDADDPLAQLVAENGELKDRALRLAAEMENLRRRTARDVHDARNYAIANFARDMLAVSDNLRRALEAVSAESKASGDSGLAGLIEGVEMTEREMLSTLERHGVRKIDPQDEKFDPNYHQAMFEVPNPDVAANTVVQVVQTGYVIGDRVLRPAMVGVAKGGPKQPAGNDDTPPAAEPGPPDEQAEKDA